MLKLQKITDKIYHLHFDKQYDLAMHFLRYQEYYECPNDRFYKNSFTLAEFMHWYAKEYGSFSYPEDWGGFNLMLW